MSWQISWGRGAAGAEVVHGGRGGLRPWTIGLTGTWAKGIVEGAAEAEAPGGGGGAKERTEARADARAGVGAGAGVEAEAGAGAAVHRDNGA